MGKSRSSLIPRLLALYKVLPRYPKSSISIEQLKNSLRSHYSDQIDEQSLTKAIRRDLELLPELFISGQLKSSGGIGNKPIKYHFPSASYVFTLFIKFSSIVKFWKFISI